MTEPDSPRFSSSFAVPASVQGIIADNAYSSHSLTVSWQKAAGVAERYEILLLNDKGILLSNTSESAAAKQHKFEDLTPGKKYKIQILTVSGGLFSKEAQTEGRTGNLHSSSLRPGSHPWVLFLQSRRVKGMKPHGERTAISWRDGDVHCDLVLPHQSASSWGLQPTPLQFRCIIKTYCHCDKLPPT